MASPSTAEPQHEAPPPPRRRRLRWALIGAGAGAVCLLLIGAAVSWHFSSAVLVPDRSDWPEETEVESLAPGRVTLSRDEDSERPGLYGIEWQAGHALIGTILAQTDDTVTRRLSRVRGYLVPGKKVAIDSYVYSGDPRQALGIPFSNVEVDGELGPMPAWFIPGPSSTWAIVVHGINSDPQVGLRIAPALRRAGLPQLLITYREDLGAPSSPDGYHHMGLTEWRDLEAAVEYALDHGAKRVVLVGYSMGGSLVTQFVERSKLAGRTSALVLDAPALNWKRILEFNSTRMGFPGFFAMPVEWAIGARIDADWESLDALDHPEDFHLPILLFHGTDDKVIPIETSDDFAAELGPWVTYFQAPKAGHTESWNVDPRLYDRRLLGFLRASVEKERARPLGSGSK